ncbi:MAG: DUF3857 domain-containing protein [Roseivirga sp.]|nr:DUF3857 domain-containing protein [Roseivirga sp.]
MKLPSVIVEDLAETSYPLDPDADAAILYDLGTSKTSDSKVMISHHKLRRIKIYSKEGLAWADWSLGLFKSKNRTESLTGFKASVYNLENGKVSRQKINKKNLITERITDDYSVVKLAFPNVKEGSIIDIEYTLQSDYLYDFSWEFQKSIPVKRSEYSVVLHSYYKFNFLVKNFFPIQRIAPTHWRFTNVPAFENEKFITSREDLITRISFNMISAQFPGQTEPIFKVGSWRDTKNLISERWKEYSFGGKEIKNYIAEKFGDALVSKEGLRKIFNQLRADFKWNKRHRLIQSTTFRKLIETKTGSSADLNRFMYGVLEAKGFKPQIHITSTLNNGRAKYKIPIIDKFNHVVNRVIVDGTVFWLDLASDQDAYDLPPTNLLGTDALEMNNSVAPLWRKIETTKGEFERSVANISLNVEEERTHVRYSLVAADYLKGQVLKQEVNQRLKRIGVAGGEDYKIDSLKLKAAERSPEPLTLDCHYSKPLELIGDLIIFNPLLVDERVTSPFGNYDERHYPIHFEHLINTNYTAFIDVPEGYTVEQLPGAVNLQLVGNLGQFFYRVSHAEGKIQVAMRYKINRVDVNPDAFPAFLQFYKKIMEKTAESIVFKKGS